MLVQLMWERRTAGAAFEMEETLVLRESKGGVITIYAESSGGWTHTAA